MTSNLLDRSSITQTTGTSLSYLPEHCLVYCTSRLLFSKLIEMNAQVSGITPNMGLFQQWMTDRGSPGNLRG